MSKFHTRRETILIPMMDGNAKPAPVHTFTLCGNEYSARQINERLIFILHRDTGLKVTAEHTGDMGEAIDGFIDSVDVGAVNLAQIVQSAATAPQINRSTNYAIELTPAGEQAVIPGCERNLAPATRQLNLFG
jgi:hypothetical protein